MNQRSFIAVALLAAALGGCAKDTSQNQSSVLRSESAEPMGNAPMTAETHFAAGQLAESRGDFDAAIFQYREALKLKKQHVNTLYRLACLQAQMKRFGDSVATWHRYIDATDHSAVGYSNLAFTEELAGNPAGAEADYKHGIARDPLNEPCRMNYGLMLARHGRFAESIVQMQTVLEPAQVHYNLASVYELQHRKEMAKLEYQQAVALDPNFADARNKLASLGDTSPQD